MFLRLWSALNGSNDMPILLTGIFLGHLDESPDAGRSLRLYADLLATLVNMGYFGLRQIEETFEECLAECQVCWCVCV